MSVLVVDASVAAKWFLQEVHTENALRLLTDPHELHAPDLLWLELHNVVCRRIRRKLIASEEGVRMLAAVRRFPIQIFPLTDLLDPATGIALDTATSLYDCLYIALAVQLDGKMVTADRPFYRGLASTHFANRVVWIEDMV